MRRIEKAFNGDLIIKPRWPRRRVFISQNAYVGLHTAQEKLKTQGIRLMLTRGYESQALPVRWMRKIARYVGGLVFCLLYPGRRQERHAIFCPNGHDKLGNSVDVRILQDDKLLMLLPYGVFTPQQTIARLQNTHGHALHLVWQTLKSAGFSVHSNLTEAMQIHCELKIGESIYAAQTG